MKYFNDFPRCSTNTRNIRKFNITKILSFKMTKRGPKTQINHKGLLAQKDKEIVNSHGLGISSAHLLPWDRKSLVLF